MSYKTFNPTFDDPEDFEENEEGILVRKVARKAGMKWYEEAAIVFMLLAVGWILGRFTEAIAVGNIKF